MPIGKVKWFDSFKGFGFIVGDEGHDIFVHFTVIEGGGYRTLVNNEVVEYECTRGPKGMLASHVKRLPDEMRRPADGGKTDPAA